MQIGSKDLPLLSTEVLAASTCTNSPSNAMRSFFFGSDDNDGRMHGTADKDSMLNMDAGIMFIVSLVVDDGMMMRSDGPINV